jgi:hypothetical protein
MATITRPGRFVALQWTRGKGYYNAHKHERPIPWREFKDGLRQPPEVAKARYTSYLLSWSLHHNELPAAHELSQTVGIGEAILRDVDRLMREAISTLEEAKDVKKKRGKKR